MNFLLAFMAVMGALLYIALIVWLMVDAEFRGAKLLAIALFALALTVIIRAQP